MFKRGWIRADMEYVLRLHRPVQSHERPDRRLSPRQVCCRPVKLVCPHTGKFLSGCTANISGSGALLEIDHPSLMVAGQQVELGVAWSSRQAILTRSQMVEATVVRSLGHGGGQMVAVSFTSQQEVPVAAAG